MGSIFPGTTPSTSATPRSSSSSSSSLKSYSEQPIQVPTDWKFVTSLDDETVVQRGPVNADIADAIKELVELTWDYDHVGIGRDARNLNHSRIEVTKVEQIESVHMYKAYERERKAFCERAVQRSFPKVTRDNGEGEVITSKQGISLLDNQLIPEINEHFLFHGAKREFVDAICKQGIDFRVGNAGMFGKGAYFCEMSTKADQYTGIERIVCFVRMHIEVITVKRAIVQSGYS